MKTIFLLLLICFTVTESFCTDYFPSDYESSKQRFLRQVRRFENIQLGSFPVGSPQLTVDHAYLPARGDTKSLLILTSGTHGPEGYTGSALQSLFLSEVLPHLDLQETGVLLVHALNPWGFKHHRRDTQNNVNLNRNFDLTEELFRTPNHGYEQLRNYIEIPRPLEHPLAFPAGNLLLQMVLRKEITQQSLTEAIGSGQYTSPRGINFGGTAFEPQTRHMIDYLGKIAEPYEQIFHIDIHTGLGDDGALHIMTKPGMNEPSRRKLSQVFSDREGDLYELTPPEAEGFYEIQGDYAAILSKLYPAKTILGITAEFGTVGKGLKGKVKTINRLVNENRGHFHGYGSPKTKTEVQRQFLELFHPSRKSWREKVLRKGRHLVEVLTKRFVAAE